MSVTYFIKNMLHRRSGPISIGQIMKKASNHFGSTFLRAMEKQLNRGSNEFGTLERKPAFCEEPTI